MITGKRILCYTEASAFTDIQGVGNDPIYRRFQSVDAVVRRHIDPQYHGFLAEPEYSQADDKIEWYVDDWGNDIAPVRVQTLSVEEQTFYSGRIQNILQHYHSVAASLTGEERTILNHALKFVDPRFVYLIGDRLVLAVWGMRPDSNYQAADGTIAHEMDYVRTHRVMFDTRPHGRLRNPLMSNMHRRDGAVLGRRDIPEVVDVEEGWRFDGWDKDPSGHRVDGDVVFTARYTSTTPPPAPPIVPPVDEPDIPETHTVTFTADQGLSLNGPTSVKVPAGGVIPEDKIPTVTASEGTEFNGWDINPHGLRPTADMTIHANAMQLPPPPPVAKPGFWEWAKKGCLGRFLIFLLLLALLLLLLWMLRDCHGGERYRRVAGHNDPALVDDPSTYADVPGAADEAMIGGIVPSTPIDPADLGAGIDPSVGPGGYHIGILPIDPALPPIQNPDDPDGPKIIPNIISVFFKHDNADLNAFAKDFRNLYPDTEKYKLDYDDYVKRVSIMMPADERTALKANIEQKLSSKYDMFVVDEIAIAAIDMGAAAAGSGFNASSSDGMAWHINAVNAPQAWQITKGSPDVVIAVVDDGCDVNHPMLSGKIVSPYNVFTKSTTLDTGSGHGTHTAALACGSEQMAGNTKVSGIAPGCKLMPVQVFGSNDNGSYTSAMVSGVAYAVHQGADVVNMSIGPDMRQFSRLSEQQQLDMAGRTGRASEEVWKRVYDIARTKNTVLVFSAGNDGVVSVLNPQNRCDSIITVTAVNPRLQRADFSDYGKGSTVASPGVEILSAMPQGRYQKMDGTSMSAPIVAGVAGLLKSSDRSLTPSQVIGYITRSARPLDGQKTGPLVQADKALAMLQGARATAPAN